VTFLTPHGAVSVFSVCIVTACSLTGSATTAGAQSPTLLTIGSPADDERRLAQLRLAPLRPGELLPRGVVTERAGVLLRDGAMVWRARGDSGTRRVALLWPQLRVVHNSALPTSLNEGALWTGRGTSALLRGGVAVAMGRWQATLAPELVVSANAPVEVQAGTTPGWSRWSSPWRTRANPADLPLRFGDAPVVAVAPGQSRLELSLGALAVGISSANLWWGPGVRNALVLSNHAAGVPHALLRTARPLPTRLGTIDARLIAGRLTESMYFDQDATNDQRALRGVALAWTPRGVEGATVGLTHLAVQRADQMHGAFLRWVFPDDGVEFWGEYATMQRPTLREWLVAPNANAGWTLGAQWLLPRARATDATWRLQLEITDVAQSRVLAGREPRDWGTGTVAIQGFTQRGRMLGVSTGPGSSHWWWAMDRWHPTWSAGAFLSRTRWENDAFHRQPIPNPFAHDVSASAGLRATASRRSWQPQAVVSVERRYNYQFESRYLVPLGRGQRTVNNFRLEFTLHPALPGGATSR
jgi:hypothetical protein